jgi:hypothetical protein
LASYDGFKSVHQASPAVSGAASAADYNGTVSKEKVACIKLEHAKRLVDFYSTPDAPNFRIFLFGVTAAGNCVFWQTVYVYLGRVAG